MKPRSMTCGLRVPLALVILASPDFSEMALWVTRSVKNRKDGIENLGFEVIGAK